MRKTITTALFSLIMVLLMLAPMAVFAATGSISVDEEKYITSDSTLTFTPEESGYYFFESFSDEESDPEAYIYLDGEVIDEDDDGGKYAMFFIRFYAEAGKTYKLKINMRDNTRIMIHVIKDIYTGFRFELTKPIEIIENTSGYTDIDDNGDSFYCYDDFDFSTGDKLILSTLNGDEEYTYDSDEGIFYRGEDEIRMGDLSWDMNAVQCANPWKLGEHDITVKYRGQECKLTIAIVETPVESLKFIPVEPFVLIEHLGGTWDEDEDEIRYYDYDLPDLNEGDRLIVKMKDGTEKEYVYNDDYEFVTADGEVLDYERHSHQNAKHWVVGSDNYFTIDIMGKEVEVPVTVKIDDREQNTLTAKGKTVRIKYKALKKKTQTIKRTKAFTVKDPEGDVSYKVAKYDKKAKKKITVSGTGKVTVKKGLKKGTYKVQVKVTADGNFYYRAKTVKTTLKIVVK